VQSAALLARCELPGQQGLAAVGRGDRGTKAGGWIDAVQLRGLRIEQSVAATSSCT
jgi:hypothetical protein